MKLIALILFVPIYAYGQITFTALDAVTSEGIEGVTVTTNDLQKTLITNEDGEFTIDAQQLPVEVILDHIAYQSKTVILDSDHLTIYLTPEITTLNDVVVTGQYAPQSVKNSVYRVKTINQERLELQGANSIADVLANELNIRFSRDNALGTSSVKLQGISGQNIKILIDGVPIAGRSGVDNQVDLDQINVNTIERIEIIEGPMAVNYGADALAGVINIITKKYAAGKLALDLNIQGESVADNFNYFDEGIHNIGLSIGSNVTKNLFIQAEGRINKFGGWVGNNDSLYSDRNRQWYPKTQYFGSGLINYGGDDYSLHYRTDFLYGTISDLGDAISTHPSEDPKSRDIDYISQRMMHQLQGQFDFVNWSFHPVLSFTDYSRNSEAYNTYPTIGLEFNRRIMQTTYYKTFFSRNTVSVNISDELNLLTGTEATYEKGGGTRLSEGEKETTDIALFISGEYLIGANLKVRPGIRYSYNSLYATKPTPSINIKYDMGTKHQLRIGYGRGFRAPSLREMHHLFVDNNHNIEGNPELTPEYSHNVNLDYTFSLSRFPISITATGFYNDITDKIGFITPQESNGMTTYMNYSGFKTIGIATGISYHSSKLNVNTGINYSGRYQSLSQSAQTPQFVFNWEANTNITYRPVRSTSLSLFYKYNGSLKDYRLVNTDGELTPELQGIDAFHLMDFSINQKIRKSLRITLGTKNLFDITSVNNNYSTAEAHGGGGADTPVGFGRSYFLRINYQFKL